MTAWPLAAIGTEPAPATIVAADRMAMTSATVAGEALKILDLLATRPQGTPVPGLTLLLTEAGVAIDGIAAVLQRLFTDRQVAAYGDILCLPDQVARLRQSWLLSAMMAGMARHHDRAAAVREAEAQRRFRAWNGWNMPVDFGE